MLISCLPGFEFLETPTFDNSQLSISTTDTTYTGEIISDSSMIVKNVNLDSVQTGKLVLRNGNANIFEQSVDLNSSEYLIAINYPKAPEIQPIPGVAQPASSKAGDLVQQTG